MPPGTQYTPVCQHPHADNHKRHDSHRSVLVVRSLVALLAILFLLNRVLLSHPKNEIVYRFAQTGRYSLQGTGCDYGLELSSRSRRKRFDPLLPNDLDQNDAARKELDDLRSACDPVDRYTPEIG